MEITRIIKDLLVQMGFSDAVVRAQDLAGRVQIDIEVSTGRDLIGEQGVILAHFQHIVRKLAAKKIGFPVILDVDVNNYRKMRENILRDFAKEVRDTVRLRGKAVELDPMPPFDRRIIHLALAEFPDIATGSAGEGWNRYVVVRPSSPQVVQPYP